MASSKRVFSTRVFATRVFAPGAFRGYGVDVAAPSVPGAEFKLTRPVTQCKLSPPATQMKVKDT